MMQNTSQTLYLGITTPKAENLAFNVVNGDIFLEVGYGKVAENTLELNIKALWKTIVTWKSCKMMTPFGEKLLRNII
jgi:hypothetical protein